MISEEMTKAINHQINREIYSAYLYLAMSSYASANKLDGFANWFNCQVKEELFHAQKMYNYVFEQGAQVILEAIEQPSLEYSSIQDTFEKTLTHEKNVTSMIADLVALADKLGDKVSHTFLQWYVKEQIEEEESAGGVLAKTKQASNDPASLAALDEELAKRAFNYPG